MDPITWFMLAAVLLALTVMAWRRWGGPLPSLRRRCDGPRLAQSVLRVHGAQRCMRTIVVLNDIVAAGDADALISVWDTIELPLVDALPDCPPEQTHALIAACEAASRLTANRDIAKRLMTVRNSLVG